MANIVENQSVLEWKMRERISQSLNEQLKGLNKNLIDFKK